MNRSKTLSDILFILWAGGAALLSYSLVYALRKPFTAAEFEGLAFCGMDYKIAVTVVQILGYLLAKFLGIKIISELRRESRLGFILLSVGIAETALVFFAVLPVPWNVLAMFFNGLALGCMWGVIFSFIEGRRVTDLLASLLGISMVVSSGTAKSVGLYVMSHFHVSEFWMPALIGAFAFPLLCFMGWMMTKFPAPTAEDIAARTKRVTLNGQQRWQLFAKFMPLLLMLFGANLLLTVQRDIKEDFIVCIIDVDSVSSWAFAYLDSIATIVLLGASALLSAIGNHLRALCLILIFATIGMGTIAFLGAEAESLDMPVTAWLFLQTFCIDIAYLSFQTIFFERFIACFKVKGNVGFFIITIDFIGYLGTLAILSYKEFMAPHIDWAPFYNSMSVFVGIACCLAFAGSIIYMIRKRYTLKEAKTVTATEDAADTVGKYDFATSRHGNLTTA